MTRILLASIIPALLLQAPAVGAESADEKLAQEDRIRELERKVDILTDELERTRQDMGVPEEKPLESVFGGGPGASKVYSLGQGLSIGGYAEAVYTNVVADKRKSGDVNRFDFLRSVVYVGYKFTDSIIFNSEYEFEHATTSSTENQGSGSVSVEFAVLDFLIRDEVNARAGLLLVPMGFVNEIHEPPFYFGNNRPEVERQIIPSTWREGGAGLFGNIGEIVDYKLYTIVSFDASGFDAGGLRGGRQKGNRALAEDMAFVGRLDVTPIPELTVGGAVFVGNTGQDRDFDTTGNGFTDTRLPSARLVLWEAHAQLRSMGFHARALFTMAHLDDARALTVALRRTGDIGATEAIADRMLGFYGEVAYEIMQWLYPEGEWTVEPFVRAEYLDTQNAMPRGFSADKTEKQQLYTFGVSVKPIPNVVLKADYRNRRARKGTRGDEVNLGIGLVF